MRRLLMYIEVRYCKQDRDGGSKRVDCASSTLRIRMDGILATYGVAKRLAAELLLILVQCRPILDR